MKQKRNTRQRQLVLEAVRARHDHPSADQIYQDVRAIDEKISRGTVYRNLNFLVESGEILHVKVANAERFEHGLDLHHHLLCTKCGNVRDVSLTYHRELDKKLEEETGYKIERHQTVFEGTCPHCQ